MGLFGGGGLGGVLGGMGEIGGSVLGAPVAIAAAGYGQYKKGRARHDQKQAQELARAQQNFGLLTMPQGGSYQDMVNQIAQKYQGDPREIPKFLEQNKHILIANLLNTGAAQDLMDTNKFMANTYAPGAANIEAGAAQGQRLAAGRMAQSGLSAAGIGSSLANQSRLAAGAAKGNLYADLMSQHLNTRYGLQRDVASMAMGFPPSSMHEGEGGGNLGAQIAQALGKIGGYVAGKAVAA